MKDGNYMGLFAGNQSAVESNVQNIMPTAGTVQSFYVFIQNPTLVGASWTLTLRKNGVDTAINCTIAGATALTCSDTTHSVVFVAGDLITVSEASTGNPSPTRGQWTAVFAP